VPPDDAEVIEVPNLHPFQRALYLSSRSGAEWLWNSNRPDGVFVPGHIPSLNVVLEDDDLLLQARGAYGLARSANFHGSERYAVRARQAILSLLASTKTDPDDAKVRFSVPPSSQVNRLAAASWMVLAIQELPEPGQDLLDQAEELCQYLRKQQKRDGSFDIWDGGEPAAGASEAALGYPGLAILALLRSHARQPAQWKLQAARAGFEREHKAWLQSKSVQVAASLTPAGAELFMATKEKPIADAVFEMGDWLCSLQYGANPRRALWQGGFRTTHKGQVVEAPPGAEASHCAEALADACRVARAAVDLQRFARYREATERSLHFMTTLQYTAANTRHFVDWYQPRLIGAFYFSHQDGNVRIDSTQAAVCGLTQYLRHVAQLPASSKQGANP
jgi:hypothetical protein